MAGAKFKETAMLGLKAVVGCGVSSGALGAVLKDFQVVCVRVSA